MRIPPIENRKNRRSIKTQQRKVQEVREALDRELKKIFRVVNKNENEIKLDEELKGKMS